MHRKEGVHRPWTKGKKEPERCSIVNSCLISCACQTRKKTSRVAYAKDSHLPTSACQEKNHQRGAEGTAQLVECFLSTYETLGKTQYHINLSREIFHNSRTWGRDRRMVILATHGV